jgi:integrase
MSAPPLLNAAGRRRSPVTLPGYLAGRPPRNKGLRYPPDPPTVEEIVVMRAAGGGAHGPRLRAFIVLLWRAGLRINEALTVTEHDLEPGAGSPCKRVFRLPTRLAVHDRVVGVALERAAREVPGHPQVKRVVHEQVRQDRRDRRPLRGSLGSLLKGGARVLEPPGRPPLDIQQHSAGIGDRLDRLGHEVPRHLVENFWTSRSIAQRYFQHRCRQAASASWADLPGR